MPARLEARADLSAGSAIQQFGRRRWFTETCTTPLLASASGLLNGRVLLVREVKPPPWNQTITGSLTAFLGAVTLRYRECSLMPPSPTRSRAEVCAGWSLQAMASR